MSLLLSPAKAQLTYDFVFTPALTSLGTPIDSFALSFGAPDFMKSGTIIDFAPFDLIGGSNSALIEFGEAFDAEGGYCFAFVTVSTELKGPCEVGTTMGQGTVLVAGNGQLPTTPGEYSYGTDFNTVVLETSPVHASSFDVLLTISSDELTTSQTPEASSLAMLAIGFSAIGALIRKGHRAACPPQ